MGEVWNLKCADGQEYTFKTVIDPSGWVFGWPYHLLKGATGHHGAPVSHTSDVVPNVRGELLHQTLHGKRELYMPISIRGHTPALFHKYEAALRKSVIQDVDHEMWITNEEGETRVLTVRYNGGFDVLVDDLKRGPNWASIPLRLAAFAPDFYDPPGSEIDRCFFQDIQTVGFLTNTVVSNLKEDATQDTKVIQVTDSAGCVSGAVIELIDENGRETNQIDTVDNATQLTLVNALANNYVVTDGAYYIEIDEVETFLNPDDTSTRVMNDNCEFVIFWMRGCPPCMTAKAQLTKMGETYPNLTITYVEIQDHEAGGDSIGMDAAKELYPGAYDFAERCGPPPPSFYGVIDSELGMMPAVIALYREGMLVNSWCGVHTTQRDPVSTEVLEDAAGPRLTWRLGKGYIGQEVVIDNTGDVASYPVWTVIGPGRSPTFTNVTTGNSFELDHNLLYGETVVVDSRDGAHTCASTKQGDIKIPGYTKSSVCPTCQGPGVIPAACCGGSIVCPTCHGTGYISTFIADSFGSAAEIGDMYNLRSKMASTNTGFWGFAPGPNVIIVELGTTDEDVSKVDLNLVRRYEGV